MSLKTTHYQLPNGRFGLTDWYPGRTTGTKSKKVAVQPEDEPVPSADDEGHNGEAAKSAAHDLLDEL